MKKRSAGEEKLARELGRYRKKTADQERELAVLRERLGEADQAAAELWPMEAERS